MSHFTVVVIVPKGTADVRDTVHDLLMPFWENDDGEELNPQSKWDWYRIGGRWDGQMLGLSSLGLTQSCRFCGATGTRTDIDPPILCNFCDGTGTEQRDGFNFGDEYTTLERNTCLVEEIALVPFAFVTTDGLWFEKGEMGWFGVVTGEEQPDKWAQKWGEARGTFVGHQAVLVDCHI